MLKRHLTVLSRRQRFDLHQHALHDKIGEGLRCRQFESMCPRGQGQQPENTPYGLGDETSVDRRSRG